MSINKSSKFGFLLKANTLEKFNQTTKSYFFLQGRVVSGDKYGSKIAFPTINLHFSPSAFLLDLGCYLSLVQVKDKYYPGLTCLIKKELAVVRCESHLINFNQNTYGQTVSVFFLQFFRQNFTFSFWQKNSRQIIQNDLKQLQKKVIIFPHWIATWKKDVKIELQGTGWMVDSINKKQLILNSQKHPDDTGSAAVQITLLQEQIQTLSKHLKGNIKDIVARRILLKKVAKFKKLNKLQLASQVKDVAKSKVEDSAKKIT